MSDWKFNKNEVLVDSDGHWWHVTDRLESIDNPDRRKYVLDDATHTARKELYADDVEGFGSVDGMFESDGWSCNCKPAAKRGIRVNGALTEPKSVDFWRGNECKHDYPCEHCGADCTDVDILVSSDYVLTDCRMCSNWECVEI